MKRVHCRPSLYAFIYEQLQFIARTYGYNLVLHGSMNRDLDLIAVVWIDEPKDDFEMIKHFDRHLNGIHSEQLEHYYFSILPGGRKSYVIDLNRGGHWNNYTDEQYYIDISVTPTK